MNIMFSDRRFIPIPDFSHTDLSLYERIVLANDIAKDPIDLWFIDRKTVRTHHNIAKNDSPVKFSWSFYEPVKECPLDFRELSLWFMLWSVSMGSKNYPGKGNPFKDCLAGFYKTGKNGELGKGLLGIGKNEVRPIVDSLASKNLLKFVWATRNSAFLLSDYRPYEHWFTKLKTDAEIPSEWKQPEARPQPSEPAAKVVDWYAMRPMPETMVKFFTKEIDQPSLERGQDRWHDYIREHGCTAENHWEDYYINYKRRLAIFGKT